MLSPLRNRFGIPGVISVIALVFAMLGGAYAASNDSGSGKASASAKAKKGPRGPRGRAGPAGPSGPAGPAGAKGDKGDTGAAGSNGSNGAVGPTGPTGKTGATGQKGQNGQDGEDGEPWVPDNTLPPGATLTGTWATGVGPAGLRRVPISFSIPLADPLVNAPECNEPGKPACEVHYIDAAGNEVWAGSAKKEPSTACDGTAAEPKADPGHLCIYTGFETETLTWNEFIFRIDGSEVSGASTAGAVMQFLHDGTEAGGLGSWAVTAEE